jgi:hypothetical protein
LGVLGENGFLFGRKSSDDGGKQGELAIDGIHPPLFRNRHSAFGKMGGRPVERRKALTSLGVGVELEWEAGWGNPTPHGLGDEG